MLQGANLFGDLLLTFLLDEHISDTNSLGNTVYFSALTQCVSYLTLTLQKYELPSMRKDQGREWGSTHSPGLFTVAVSQSAYLFQEASSM